jgi:hypothetical protein
VGTVGGTLWYINWTERTSIRLVSSHTQKVYIEEKLSVGDVMK